MALCGYDDPYVEDCTRLLTLARMLNATVFGFVPDVVFSADTYRAVAIRLSGVAAGIGSTLNF